MRDDLERLSRLLREGRCCAVALAQLGLELSNAENEQLLNAMSGLCGGVQGGLLCGALTGAACMMSLLAPEDASARMVPELTQWFIRTMGERYGGTDCRDILGGEPLNKKARCPAVIEDTYLQAMAILERNGLELDR